MNKKRIAIISGLTAAVLLVLSIFISSTIRTVNNSVRQACFDRLDNTSKQLAKNLYEKIDMDRTVLTAMAAIIAQNERYDDRSLCGIMRSYISSSSFITFIQLLRPDNTILTASGDIYDASGYLNFADEVLRGVYVSGITQGISEPGEKVLRCAVPVVQNSQVIYILYGVVPLNELSQHFTTNIYNGNAYVYIVDGETGDFILDTWHPTLGNIYEMNDRQTLPGYSFEQMLRKLHACVGGNIAIISSTSDDVLFMRYDPICINRWNVMITVEEKYAFSDSASISTSLYIMAAVIGVVLLLYMVCITVSLLRAYRQVQKLGTEDQTTGLQNRNAYDNFVFNHSKFLFASISCCYIDVNGLHEINNQRGHAEGDRMLRAIADALKACFDFSQIYRIGGDEFVVYCTELDADACAERMNDVIERIKARNYSASYGIICCKNETGLERVTREADELMLKYKKAHYAENDRRQR